MSHITAIVQKITVNNTLSNLTMGRSNKQIGTCVTNEHRIDFEHGPLECNSPVD